MQLSEDICRKRILEEQLRAQTCADPEERVLHLGAAQIYEEELLLARQKDSRHIC